MLIAKVEINGKEYKVVTTRHAEQRMSQRHIDKYLIAGNIISLGSEKLERLQNEWEEAIIIDKEKGFSMVIAFYPNQIKLVTVIDKTNVFVKSKTAVEVI